MQLKKTRQHPITISVITCLFIIGFGHSWIQHTVEEWLGDNHRLLNQITETEAEAIKNRIERSLLVPEIIATQLRIHGPDNIDFDRQADNLIELFGNISNLQLAPNGIVQSIHPLAGNEKVIGYNILRDEQQRAEALRSIQFRSMNVVGPIELIQGGVGIIGRYPVFIDDRFWGFSSVLILIEDLIQSSRLPLLEKQGYNYRLTFKEPLNLRNNITIASSKQPLGEVHSRVSIQVKDKRWLLELSNTKTSVLLNKNIAYTLLILTAMIISYLLYLQVRKPLRLNAFLEKTNKERQYQTRFLEAVLEHVSDAVVACNKEGELSYFNSAAQKLHGKGCVNLPPEQWADTYQLYEADGETPMLTDNIPLNRAFQGHDIPDTEMVIKRNDGESRRMIAKGQPLFDQNKQQLGAVISMQDITLQHQAKLRQKRRADILQSVVNDLDIKAILRMIALDVEQLMPGCRCSILLVSTNGAQLEEGAAPNLPDFYNQAVEGIAIADNTGSCSTAAFRKERVVVSDVTIHPYWKDFTELAKQANIAACWSQPILSNDGDLLGTFAIYHSKPQIPSPSDIAIIEDAAALTSISIVRQVTADQLNTLSQAVEQNPNTVIITDREGFIEYVNPSFVSMTGYDKAEVIGRSPSLLSSGDADPAIYQDLWEHLHAGKNWRGELHNRRKDGSCYWLLNHISPICGPDGETHHFVAIQEDITELRRINEVVSRQASHDQLTGLLNRTGFEQTLASLVKSTQSTRAQSLLMYIDIDRFKVINDGCGHVAGDELLRQFSALLTDNLPQAENAARLGVDEFVMILNHCPQKLGMRHAEELLDTIRQFSFSWQQQSFQISACIGISLLDHQTIDADTAMLQVETACTLAKAQGPNRIHFFNPLDAQHYQDQKSDMNWAAEIKSALLHNRFQLYVQQIKPLQANRKPSYEVLLRLKMADGSIVSPGEFLPVAERFKLASQIDAWVFDNCMRWLAANPGAIEKFETLSINLSGQSMTDHSLLSHICYEISAQAIPTTKIKFEITETAAIANLTEANTFIKRLRDEGCKFALDDFGSGLSSFAYLKNIPVDTLKIDGMFVKDMDSNHVNRAMVKSIHDIGHIMGMETVAEFVENEQIQQQLTEIGVDYGQGYAIAHPAPIANVLGDQHEKAVIPS